MIGNRVLIALLAVTLGEDPHYALIDLGVLEPLNPETMVEKMNDSGIVVGNSDYVASNELFQAIVWSAGQGLRELGFYDSCSTNCSSTATDINESGMIVGNSRGCMIWLPNGDVIPVGDLTGTACSGCAINEVGELAGIVTTDEGDQHAAWFDGFTMHDLGTLGGTTSWANDINDSSDIVGWSRVEEGYAQAFLWTSGTMIRLMDLERRYASAQGINNAGLIVGDSKPGFDQHAVIWEKGVIRDIHPANIGPASAAIAVNELNDVLIEVLRDNGDHGTVVWSNGEYIDVEAHLPPNVKFDLNFPRDINIHGQICVTDSRGLFDDSKGVLVTPVSPTLAITNLIPGSAGETNGIRVTGLNPGQRVYVMWGIFGGGTLIPGCDILDNVGQIEDAKLAVAGNANANGVATLKGFMPGNASGRTILFQAIAPDTCSISNLVQQTIE